MPHLRFEYSPGLEDIADLPGFAQAMRAAMAESGVFQPGGIRVRGFRADVAAVADGGADRHFLDIQLRMGAGRGSETRAQVADALYAEAVAVLEPALAGWPFALSLEVIEIDPGTSRKSWNTLHDAVSGGTDGA